MKRCFSFTISATDLFEEMEQESRANARRLSISRNLIAGGFGGMFAWLASYPLDTVKTRLQAMPSTGQPPYSGPIDCLRNMIQREGVKSLYRGVSLPLMVSIPSNAVMFYSLTLGKRLQLTDHGQEPTLFQYMNAGFFCGFTLVFVTAPTERIKCMLQAKLQTKGKSNKQGPWFLIKTIYQQEGFKGFYRGVFPQWGFFIIGFGAWYVTYEGLLKSMRPRDKTRDDVTMASIFFSGAVSGTVMWALCFPFDVLKTKYQISQVGKYRGSRYILREILRNEGIKGLYKGYGTALIRAPVFNAALVIGYELSLKTMMRLLPF